MEHGTRIYLASGAVGGFDVLRTTSLMALAQKMKAEGCLLLRPEVWTVILQPEFLPEKGRHP